MLHVADVELVKDDKPILHDLNIQVGEAEIRSILGVNGNGKSTLAYAIMGLIGYEPTAGRIWPRSSRVQAMEERFLYARQSSSLAGSRGHDAHLDARTVTENLKRHGAEARPSQRQESHEPPVTATQAREHDRLRGELKWRTT